jgi:hypothetical protein
VCHAPRSAGLLMLMLNSKGARAFAVLAALAAVGCGQARQEMSGEAAAGRSAFETVAAGDFIPGTMACPTFACRVGAILYADFPLRFEEALGANFEACRNEICFAEVLPVTTPAPSEGGGAPGFRLPMMLPPSGSDFADLTLMNAGGLYLKLHWTPFRVNDLQSGDQYRVSVTDTAGKRRVLIDQVVMYSDHSIGTPDKPCYQNCLIAEVSLIGQGSPDPSR